MVIYGTIEIDGRTMARAKSDRGKYIVDGDGRYYADAVYPAGDGRTFTESEIDIDDEVPRARVFSKLRLEDALFRAGVLNSVDAFIDSQTVTNKYGQVMLLRRKYQTANDFSEAHPLFKQFKTALQQALGWTDEQVEAVLAEAELR